jgi:hypothetical protein
MAEPVERVLSQRELNTRRTGILPEEFRPLVFSTKNPQSVGTFTVDGAVAGSWRYEDGRIRLSPFGRMQRAARREAEEEAAGLAASTRRRG